jgi:hypothetical protein
MRIRSDKSSGFEGGEMKDLTRRRFLTHSTIGVAFAGALALVPGVAAALRLPNATSKVGLGKRANGPVVAHVRDLVTGEIAFLVGTERFIVRDRELAMRMHLAARSR